MGVTKSEIFTDKQNKLAAMMKALAHPARIAIVQHLIKANACINGDLVEELGLAQPTISQHLKVLEAAGLIVSRIDGTRRPRRISKDGIEAMDQWLSMLRKALEKNYDRLDQVLATMKAEK